MAEAKENPVFLNRRFQDFDEMVQTLHGWNLDILQLDRGRFRGDILQIGIGHALVGRAMFNRDTWQRGLPPEGFRTFALLIDPLPHMTWRKQKVYMNQVMAFPPGGELDAVTRKGFFKVYTLSFTEELLFNTCRSMMLPDLNDLLGNKEVLPTGPAMMGQLIYFLHGFCRRHRESPLGIGSRSVRQVLEAEVAEHFLATLASSRMAQIGTRMLGRDRIFKRLENVIARIPHDLPSVPDLCEAAQVSERTLQYAFRDRFGMTPLSYLKTIRLNGAHRELSESNPRSTRVADVAGQWGFRHMGQFAADYREQFGELPSRTLMRWHSSRMPVRI